MLTFPRLSVPGNVGNPKIGNHYWSVSQFQLLNRAGHLDRRCVQAQCSQRCPHHRPNASPWSGSKRLASEWRCFIAPLFSSGVARATQSARHSGVTKTNSDRVRLLFSASKVNFQVQSLSPPPWTGNRRQYETTDANCKSNRSRVDLCCRNTINRSRVMLTVSVDAIEV